jgi:hypothetical protein
MELVERFDKGEIREPKVDDAGFLHLDATVTRVGVFKYLMADGRIRREFRPDSEVFSNKNIESIKRSVITNEHPPKRQRVTVKNAKHLQVGYADSDARIDGNFLRIGVVVTDEDTIREIKRGDKKEISCGYDCYIDPTPGVWEGPNGPEEYDVIQRGHINNHIAITKQGRAGPEVRLHTDSAIQIDEDITMTKFEIDGVSLEMESGTAALVQNIVQKRNDSITDLNQKIDQLQARVDQLIEGKKKIEEEKVASVDSAEEFNRKVQQRVSLLRSVESILPAEQLEKADALSDTDIKKLCLMKQTSLTESDLATKSEAYVDARFDSLLENTEKNTKKNLGASLLAATDSKDAREITAAKIAEKMSAVDNAWKRK